MFKELRVFEYRVLLQPHSNPTGSENLRWHERRVKICHFLTVCNSPHANNPPVNIKPGALRNRNHHTIFCKGGLPLLSSGMWHLSMQCPADVVGKHSFCPRQRGRSGSEWICGGLRWVVRMSPPYIYYCAVRPIRVMKGYEKSHALGSHWACHRTGLLFPSLRVGWPLTSRCLNNHETKRPCTPSNPYKYKVL